MHELGKPIIAMVNGSAIAGGLGLMVACDLAIAADTATFGTTEIAVGLWPMMITAEITRSVGRKATLEMMLTGRKLAARSILVRVRIASFLALLASGVSLGACGRMPPAPRAPDPAPRLELVGCA